MNDEETIEALQYNQGMLLRKIDKLELQYKNMHTREMITRLKYAIKEKQNDPKHNKEYARGLIDMADFVLSNKKSKEILLQKR